MCMPFYNVGCLQNINYYRDPENINNSLNIPYQTDSRQLDRYNNITNISIVIIIKDFNYFICINRLINYMLKIYKIFLEYNYVVHKN